MFTAHRCYQAPVLLEDELEVEVEPVGLSLLEELALFFESLAESVLVSDDFEPLLPFWPLRA
jgi:hypothetical protein